MIHLTMKELGELRESLASLEDVLVKLDRVGAGIAAIHVDAAINQLKNNMEIVAEDSAQEANTSQSCPSEFPLSSR